MSSQPRIITSFIYPPIPTRHWDWVAYLDGHEEGAQGFGETEADAIAGLIEDMELIEGVETNVNLIAAWAALATAKDSAR